MKRIVNTITAFLSHPVAKGGLIIFLGSMVSNVGAYFYHVIVGRLLGPEGYGELASLYSLTYLLNVPALVVQTVIAKYIAGFASTHDDGKSKKLFLDATRLLAFVSLILCVLCIPLFGVISNFLHIKNAQYVAYMVLSSGIFFVAMVASSTLQGYQKFTDIAIFSNIGIGLRLVGGVIGAMFGVGMTAFLNTVTTLLSYLVMFVPLRFLWKAKTATAPLPVSDIGKFALPSMFTILGITSLYSTDIMLVKHYFSSLDAGLYAGVAMLGKVIFFASSSIAYVLFPAVAQQRQAGQKSDAMVYNGLKIVGLISAGVTVLYFLFPQTALSLLFGAQYLEGAKYLGSFGIFITFYSLNNVLSTVLLGLGRTRVYIMAAIAAVLQVIGIAFMHETIWSVITVNTIINVLLFIALLVYYRHGKD